MSRMDEIAARLNNTTKGEWHFNSSSCVLTLGELTDIEAGRFKYRVVAPFIQFSMVHIINDFIFIENSKKDIEYLLDEVKRLRKIDSWNAKSKEEIYNKIQNIRGQIQVLETNPKTKKHKEIFDEINALDQKITALEWVLGIREEL